MTTACEEEDSFKTQWNYFTTYVYEFIESRFATDEEKLQFKKQLSDCSTHSQRIELVLEDPQMYESIASTVADLILKLPLAQEKQSAYEASKKLLRDMQHLRYEKMLETYTMAISLLLSDMSNPLSYDLLVGCLLKRVDLLYLMERYEDCYDDISDLKTMNVPQEEMMLVPSIEEKCLLHLSKVNRIVKPNDIQVMRENPKLDGVIADSEVVYTEEKGRMVRSTNVIPEKTIIAAEEPFACWLRPNAYDEYCNHCLLKLNSRYLLCNDCFNVRYCSLQCREKAWNSYHEIECHYLPVIKNWAMGHIALRMSIIPGTNTLLEVAKKNEPVINFNNDYACVYSLTGEQCLTDDYYIAAALGAALVSVFASKMNLIEESSEDFYLYGSLIFKHIAQVYLNTYTVYDQDMRYTPFKNIYSTNEERKKIGVAIYASCSLFSHSCESNCLKYYCGSKIVLINTVAIAANGEITVNYGTCSSQSTIQDRADFLMSNFGFECKCEACEVKLECIAFAFICPLCKGPLICNENESNYCANCLQRNVDVTGLLKMAEEGKTLVNTGEEYALAGELKKAKQCYTKAGNLYKQIYYSPYRLFGISTSLAVLYEARGKHYKAYKNKTSVDSIVSETYGDESLELIDHYIECGQLLKIIAKKVLLNKGKYQKKSESYFQEAFKRFTQATKAEFQIVSNTRTSFIEFMNT